MDRTGPAPPATAAWAALGAHLRDLGYDEPHFRARLHQRSVQRITPQRVAVAERRAGDDALASAIRFWHLRLPLARNESEAVLGDVRPDALAAAGIIRQQDGAWVAAQAISPVEDLLVCHDFDDGSGFTADHVIGVGPAALTLASLTPRDQVGRLLDLGTGGGVQALLGSVHAERVTATDISERALGMARLGAALNGAANIEFRQGDGFEPVAGEEFDLIVANPPFVISPDDEYVFRDGGERGDGLSRRLVRQAASHLTVGGIAVILVNWLAPAGARAADPPHSWVDGLDCDALILRHDALDPLAYAERWAMAADSADLDSHRRTLARWVDHLAGAGAERVVSGAIVLRRRRGPGRMREARFPKRPHGGGPQVRRMLDAMGRFDGPADPALADATFRLVEGQRLEQSLVFRAGRFTAADAVLRTQASAGVLGTIPAEMLEALFEMDGQRSVERVVADVAAARGVPAQRVGESLRPVLLELYELGFLELADPVRGV